MREGPEKWSRELQDEALSHVVYRRIKSCFGFFFFFFSRMSVK